MSSAIVSDTMSNPALIIFVDTMGVTRIKTSKTNSKSRYCGFSVLFQRYKEGVGLLLYTHF